MHSEWTTTISIGVLSTVSSPRGKSASVKQKLSLSPPSPSGSCCSVCFPSCGFSSSGWLTWMLFQLCDFLHQTSLTGNFWGSPYCNIISCYCSVARSCLTLCDPLDCSMPGFLVYHQLPELAHTHVHWVGDAIQPSHPLAPFSSCPQSFPASGSFPMSWLFASGDQSVGVSASVIAMNIQGWFPLELSLCIYRLFIWWMNIWVASTFACCEWCCHEHMWTWIYFSAYFQFFCVYPQT